MAELSDRPRALSHVLRRTRGAPSRSTGVDRTPDGTPAACRRDQWPVAVETAPPRGRLMLFARSLRERIRRGRIRCTIRIWTHARVKAGGRYKMDDGHVVVDSITPITIAAI